MNKKEIFIGYFDIISSDEHLFDKLTEVNLVGNGFKKNIYEIENIISQDEIELLLKLQKDNSTIPVGIDGIAKNYVKGDKVHSYRSTFYSESIAEILFKRIQHKLSLMTSAYENSHDLFKPVGLNPAFRFIDYTQDGFLVPHYDFPYKKNDNVLTLMSLVIYLTSSLDGKTRFIREHRINDYSDWDRKAKTEEILFAVSPKAGSALLFPHNILHDSETVDSNKVILRTDVLFKRIEK